MRATIIVRNRHTRKIASLMDVQSVDEVTVSAAVEDLSKRFPIDRGFQIDTSQVEMARRACAA